MNFMNALRLASLPLIAALGWLPIAHAEAEKPASIRIAVPDISSSNRSTGSGITVVMDQQHLLEKEFAADGIKIQWLYFKGVGPEINEAYANGQIDFAYLGDLAAIVGKSGGLDTRVLAATLRDIPGYLAVPPGSPIASLKDLKDKRVALAKGTANHLAFNSALRTQGMTEKDVRVINLDAHSANAALAAGHLDAIWGPSNLLVLQARGLANVVVDASTLPAGAGKFQAMLLGRGAFVDRYPDITRRFVRVSNDAAQWLREAGHKALYSQVFSELSGYPQDVDPLKDRDFAEVFNPQLDQAFVSQLQASIDLAQELRLIRRPFDVHTWIAKP